MAVIQRKSDKKNTALVVGGECEEMLSEAQHKKRNLPDDSLA